MLKYYSRKQKEGAVMSFDIRQGILYSVIPDEKQTEIILPNDVEAVWFDAFELCQNIEAITINEGTKYIKGGAFLECTSLKKVYIPQSVQKIHVFDDNYILNNQMANSKGGYSEFRNAPYGFIVIGEKGSFAEKYCAHFEIPFKTNE